MALRNPARLISTFLFGETRNLSRNNISEAVKAKIKDTNLRSIYEEIQQTQLEAMKELHGTQGILNRRATDADTVARTYFMNLWLGGLILYEVVEALSLSEEEKSKVAQGV